MKSMIEILKIIVFLFLAFSLFLFLFQDRMIFYPQKVSSRTVSRYKEIEITFNHDNVLLCGWFVKGRISKSKPLVIYYGGNAEEISWNLDEMKTYGMESFLLVNYRGYGNSQGKPSEKKLVDDALFILDQITRNHQIDPKHIVLMGRSLGTGVAVQVAAKKDVGGVILVTPFDSLVSVAKSHYPVFPVNLLLRHRFDSVLLAPDIKIPALFMMGSNDRIIANRHSIHLAEKWGGAKTSVVIKGAGHNDIEAHGAFKEAIVQFLREIRQGQSDGQ